MQHDALQTLQAAALQSQVFASCCSEEQRSRPSPLMQLAYTLNVSKLEANAQTVPVKPSKLQEAAARKLL